MLVSWRPEIRYKQIQRQLQVPQPLKLQREIRCLVPSLWLECRELRLLRCVDSKQALLPGGWDGPAGAATHMMRVEAFKAPHVVGTGWLLSPSPPQVLLDVGQTAGSMCHVASLCQVHPCPLTSQQPCSKPPSPASISTPFKDPGGRTLGTWGHFPLELPRLPEHAA